MPPPSSSLSASSSSPSASSSLSPSPPSSSRLVPRRPHTPTPPSPMPLPAFNDHFTTPLGSPFLTTSLSQDQDAISTLDLIDGSLSTVPRQLTVTRPASPDFSILSPPSPSLSQLEFTFYHSCTP